MQHFITHNKVSSNTATFKTMLIQCLESNTIALVAKTMYTLSKPLDDIFNFSYAHFSRRAANNRGIFLSGRRNVLNALTKTKGSRVVKHLIIRLAR